MFLTMPPCEGSLAAHFKKRADAALRICSKLARAVAPSPILMGWKKHSALSGTHRLSENDYIELSPF